MNGKESYGLSIDATSTTEILTSFIREEVHKAGMSRVVVGLSGGLDSAVAAYLATRALGPEGVYGIRMPYRTSSPESVADAGLVIETLGIESESVDISPMVDGFEEITAESTPLRLGNVMARCRMIILYDRSAALRGLVLGTGNRSEVLLGYGTIHGDTASAINPLGNLYKTQVRQLAEHLGVPRRIVDKPPSADLWPDQTDEAELGFTYEEVDRLLMVLVDSGGTPDDAVVAGFTPGQIERVRSLIAGSRFKRRMPLVPGISAPSEPSS